MYSNIVENKLMTGNADSARSKVSGKFGAKHTMNYYPTVTCSQPI